MDTPETVDGRLTRDRIFHDSLSRALSPAFPCGRNASILYEAGSTTDANMSKKLKSPWQRPVLNGGEYPSSTDITASTDIRFRAPLQSRAEVHRRIDEWWRCANRAMTAMVGSTYTSPTRLVSRWRLHRRQAGTKHALPQQSRRHLHRRHREGRVGISLLGDGRRRRRLQQ